MARTTEAQKKATAKYDKANTRQITFKFNLETDADILERLDSVPNRQGYIKELIRKDMASMKKYIYWEQNGNNDVIEVLKATNEEDAIKEGRWRFETSTPSEKKRIIAAQLIDITGYEDFDDWAEDNYSAYDTVYDYK